MQSTDTHCMEYDIASGELADEALDRDCGSGSRFTCIVCGRLDGAMDTRSGSGIRFTAGQTASTFFDIDGD